MKKRNNTWTIIRKEFARFFGDRQLVFTTVIMPGLLIYLIYSLMGVGIRNMETHGEQDVVTVRVENMPQSVAPILSSLDSSIVILQQPVSQADIDALQDKEINAIAMRFPADFDALVANYDPMGGQPAPNVEIYYNSANNASDRVFTIMQTALNAYEDGMANRFDINRADEEGQTFNQASDDQVVGDILSKLLPMLIIMMLFSGVMAIAPSSMPNMIQADSNGIEIPFNYTTSDYAALLLVIFASVLVMASAISLLSALAKDVKNAGTMITPFMLVVMLAGLLPMFQTETVHSLVSYFIPFYNSIQVMADVFAHSLNWTALLITLGSNIVYTGIAIWGLTRMFNSEKVMFSK